MLAKTIIKADCANCRYGFFRDDKKETLVCKIAGRYEKYPVNEQAKEMIEAIEDDREVTLCESHQPHPNLQFRVIYD
ncbi:hypothetical protein HYW74_00205 [Candidatus Pacearchaeota archaeon]|nr:hypothetical protein [Candidatus Pacearchaeota archaeon]